MANTIIPSQIGYTAPGSALRSQIYLGKQVTVDFEAVGLGAGGRPDELEALKIHISQNGQAQVALYIDVTDILALKASNPNLTGEVFLQLKKVSVCEVNDTTGESEEKGMIILGSSTFAI